MASQCSDKHTSSDSQLVKIEQLIQAYAAMLTDRLKDIHQIRVTATTTLSLPHIIMVHLQLQHLETSNQVSSITHINLHENVVVQLDRTVEQAIDKLFKHIQWSLLKDRVPCPHCGEMGHHWPKVKQNTELIDSTTFF